MLKVYKKYWTVFFSSEMLNWSKFKSNPFFFKQKNPILLHNTFLLSTKKNFQQNHIEKNEKICQRICFIECYESEPNNTHWVNQIGKKCLL